MTIDYNFLSKTFQIPWEMLQLFYNSLPIDKNLPTFYVFASFQDMTYAINKQYKQLWDKIFFVIEGHKLIIDQRCCYISNF